MMAFKLIALLYLLRGQKTQDQDLHCLSDCISVANT